MTATEQTKPGPLEEILLELNISPMRHARMTEVKQKLSAAVEEAADEMYEVLLGNRGDVDRRLAASLLLRPYVESVVNEALDRKAKDRGPLFP